MKITNTMENYLHKALESVTLTGAQGTVGMCFELSFLFIEHIMDMIIIIKWVGVNDGWTVDGILKRFCSFCLAQVSMWKRSTQRHCRHCRNG